MPTCSHTRMGCLAGPWAEVAVATQGPPSGHVWVGVPGWGVALLSLPRVPLQVDNGPMALKNLPEQLCKLSVGGDECVHILNPLPKE